MALPLLAPLAPLIPLLKVLALGSLKFVGIGLGAAIAPVSTANFLVGLSAGTPMKFAKFRHRHGHFSDEELSLLEQSNQLLQQALKDPQQHMSRQQARQFLKEILLSTLANMKTSAISLPQQLMRFVRQLLLFTRSLFSTGKK